MVDKKYKKLDKRWLIKLLINKYIMRLLFKFLKKNKDENKIVIKNIIK